MFAFNEEEGCGEFGEGGDVGDEGACEGDGFGGFPGEEGVGEGVDDEEAGAEDGAAVGGLGEVGVDEGVVDEGVVVAGGEAEGSGEAGVAEGLEGVDSGPVVDAAGGGFGAAGGKGRGFAVAPEVLVDADDIADIVAAAQDGAVGVVEGAACEVGAEVTGEGEEGADLGGEFGAFGLGEDAVEGGEVEVGLEVEGAVAKGVQVVEEDMVAHVEEDGDAVEVDPGACVIAGDGEAREGAGGVGEARAGLEKGVVDEAEEASGACEGGFVEAEDHGREGGGISFTKRVKSL